MTESVSASVDPTRIAVIGLGYVGLPLAVAFSREFATLGYDIDAGRVAALREGQDGTGELDADELVALQELALSADAADLVGCKVFVIAVPTPVNRHKFPDLQPLLAASELVGRALAPGALVIFESTVYPGATEEVCVPLLERISGLACGRDFEVGYSPERINPGDRGRRLADIVKVTSGSSPAAAARVDALYRRIIRAGTHLAPDIRTAEAAKAIENIQRDVNIALMNELAQIFHRLGIDTEAVLAAAGSKWNFLPFRPGLVGGHCIGVDPYYLIHKAQEAGHHPLLITDARRINEGMASYVCARLLRRMALQQISPVGARVLVLGVAFKENCADLRNSQVGVIIGELRDYHMRLDVYDPWVDPARCEAEYGIRPLATLPDGGYDAVLLAVAHREFAALGGDGVRALLAPGGIVFDVKHVLPPGAAEERL
jgi:UDP-N-acetyl-D-glucosamine/UDP-N-acetyl-D-galactosamine dehydrogenase